MLAQIDGWVVEKVNVSYIMIAGLGLDSIFLSTDCT